MNICMKIGLGLKFSPTTVLQIKLSFVKTIQKLKHSFFVLFFLFFDNGPFIGRGGGIV